MRKIVIGLVMGGLALLAGPVLWTFFIYAAATTPTATVLGPGREAIAIEKPGVYTLSYDYHTVFRGHTYDLDKSLPPGWDFHLTSPSGVEVPLDTSLGPITSFSQPAMTGEDGEAKPTQRRIGTFRLSETGTYDLNISGQGEPRPFSLRRDIDNPALVLFSCCLGPFLSLGLGVTGLVLLILGIIEVARRPREQSNTTTG